MTILLHVLIVAALLNAIPKYIAQKIQNANEVFLPVAPEAKTRPPPRHRYIRNPTGAAPSYRRFTLPPEWIQQPNLRGLNLALQSCLPEKLATLGADIRATCERIEAALLSGQDALPNALRIKNSKRWQTELLIKQAPLLIPCASPYGISPLYTLMCISNLIANGYHPEDVEHYVK
ncbi:MAG: hypothetical protein KGJ79_00005 [Alphaproteobacteria bacterium]|nr:hypothetical protein [Alphaproteobacteria bacterium]MDE2109493.1 hypothetical protein [Alphaproteobacteria bacterium]MDE2495360.1 hypothetical protein [Alphaproteobacteria bacterium]